jgi:hypothetical protein
VDARWNEGRWRLDYSTAKDFAGPVATVVAALSAVGVTGYFARRQWRTAKDKLLLALFDKRFDLYQELRAVVGRRNDPTSLFDFGRVASRAQFLFGPEVQTFLKESLNDLRNEKLIREVLPGINEDRREAMEGEQHDRLTRLNRFFKDFDKLVAPYMSHHQRG